MIKASGERVVLKGRPETLLAELTDIVSSMNDALSKKFNEEMAKKVIMKAFEVGVMTDEEFEEEVEKLDEREKEVNEGIADLLYTIADALSGKEKKEDGSEQ